MEDELLRQGILLILPLILFMGILLFFRDHLIAITLMIAMNHQLRQIRLLYQRHSLLKD